VLPPSTEGLLPGYWIILTRARAQRGQTGLGTNQQVTPETTHDLPDDAQAFMMGFATLIEMSFALITCMLLLCKLHVTMCVVCVGSTCGTMCWACQLQAERSS